MVTGSKRGGRHTTHQAALVQNLLENVRKKCQVFVPDYAQQPHHPAAHAYQDANGQYQQMPGMQMGHMGACSGSSCLAKVPLACERCLRKARDASTERRVSVQSP